MFQFCFNDCLPQAATDNSLVNHLTTTLTHYGIIKKAYPENVNGIITSSAPNNLLLNEAGFSLANCIHHLSRDLKKFALASFNKHPHDSYLKLLDEDRLLEKEYALVINSQSYDAMNAKIAEENGGILLTLPLHKDLMQNSLTIIDKDGNGSHVVNQYGADANTAHIKAHIKTDILSRAGLFEQLLALAGPNSFTERFRNDFETLTAETQHKLIKETNRAISRNGITRFYVDDLLIKDVTPSKNSYRFVQGRTPDTNIWINVYEMRIFNPVAIRMYFYETPDKIYFGSIERKPAKKVQTNDIINAASVIRELVALDNR